MQDVNVHEVNRLPNVWQRLLIPASFPRYCNEKGCKANSASAALNKWMKQTIGDDYVMHSFRHSMRDRLRAVSCPSEMIDQIGGWSSGKVGDGYGEGYSVLQTAQWMTQLPIK